MTTAVFNDDGTVPNRIELNILGDVVPPYCKVDTFKSNEYVTDMTFYFTKDKIAAVGYSTSINTTPLSGKTTGTGIMTGRVTFNETNNLIGFFGTATSRAVLSLGPIRRDQNCSGFSDLQPKINTTINPLDLIPNLNSLAPEFETWKIIAIGIGIIVLAVGLIALLILFLCTRKKTKIQVLNTERSETQNAVDMMPDLTPVEDPDE